MWLWQLERGRDVMVGNRETKGGKPGNSRGRRWMWEKGERQKWALKQTVSPTPLGAAPHLSME